MLKLGKKKAVYDSRDLQFGHYMLEAPCILPPVPSQFGHEGLVTDWGMLGNDTAGCCVLSGGGHETMLWNAEAGRPVDISTENTLADYSAVTGYTSLNPATDRGTNVRDALKYRQQTGLLDAAGNRHKIGAYVALEPGNIDHLLQALYLFGAVGIGINFPDSAMHQFDKNQPWGVCHGAKVEGGHYIPLVAYRTASNKPHQVDLVCVTWGRLQQMTRKFYETYCDEAWAILSPEMLKDGKSLEGFDLNQLQNDLSEVTK
jgi:hypothetical protein